MSRALDVRTSPGRVVNPSPGGVVHCNSLFVTRHLTEKTTVLALRADCRFLRQSAGGGGGVAEYSGTVRACAPGVVLATVAVVAGIAGVLYGNPRLGTHATATIDDLPTPGHPTPDPVRDNELAADAGPVQASQGHEQSVRPALRTGLGFQALAQDRPHTGHEVHASPNALLLEEKTHERAGELALVIR